MEARRPLDGIKVLDFSHAFAAPFCAMLLADMGAEVVKLEPPEGDDMRRSLPRDQDGIGVLFTMHNRNKKAITLNLRSPKGRDLLHKLIKHFDVLDENYRPGVMGRLGCDYATLNAINPRLVMVSISGFGQSGPYAQRGADDKAVQAMSGTMHLTGLPAGEPTRVAVALADYISGTYAALSVVSALYLRQQTGKGQYVDLSLFDSLVTMLARYVGAYAVTGDEPQRTGNREPFAAADGLFRAKDGYIYLSAGQNLQWSRLCQAMGRDDVANDPFYQSRDNRCAKFIEINDVIDAWLGGLTVSEAAPKLLDAGVAFGPVQTVSQVMSDPQIASRGLVSTLPTGMPAIGLPFQFSDVPRVPAAPPPALGQNNEEVYGGWLGLSKRKLDALKSEGVI